MKAGIKSIAILTMMSAATAGYAIKGNFFNISSTGSSLTIATNIPNHVYRNAGIKITTPGVTLSGAGTECTMASNGFCLFSVSQTSPVTLSISSVSGGMFSARLCLNGSAQLSCQDYNDLNGSASNLTPTQVYVANYLGSPSVSLCSLDSNGNITTCSGAGGESVLAGQNIEGIVQNTAGTMAYLTGYNSTNKVYQCNINSSDSTFSSCSAVTISSPAYSGSYGFIALNPDNSYAFFPNGSSAAIYACPISGGVIGGTCANTGATGMSSNASGITFNAAGSTAYIASFDLNSITVCSVSGTTFSGCVNKTGGSSFTFNQPGQAALSKDESLVYVTSFGNNSVFACSTTPVGGSSFSSCVLAATITGAWGITLNSAGTVAYVSDFSSNVSVCPINTNGTFGTCVATGGFSDPIQISLRYH